VEGSGDRTGLGCHLQALHHEKASFWSSFIRALLTEEYMEAKAKRASLTKFQGVLEKFPDSEPEDYDRI
jgi:hypothetical protein